MIFVRLAVDFLILEGGSAGTSQSRTWSGFPAPDVDVDFDLEQVSLFFWRAPYRLANDSKRSGIVGRMEKLGRGEN